MNITDLLVGRISGHLEKLCEKNEKISRIRKLFLWDAGTFRTQFLLENGKVSIVQSDGKPDIIIEASEQDVRDVLERKVDPMEAYSNGRLKIRASLMDKLLLSELL